MSRKNHIIVLFNDWKLQNVCVYCPQYRVGTQLVVAFTAVHCCCVILQGKHFSSAFLQQHMPSGHSAQTESCFFHLLAQKKMFYSVHDAHFSCFFSFAFFPSRSLLCFLFPPILSSPLYVFPFTSIFCLWLASADSLPTSGFGVPSNLGAQFIRD